MCRPLSPRQEQVLACLCAGDSTKEAARRLGMSPWTLKEHLAQARARLGARSSLHAAVLYACATRGARPFMPQARALVPAVALLPAPRSVEEAFWLYVERGADGCWRWRGPRSLTGAGWTPRCYLPALRPLGRSARRIAYMLANGVRLPPDIVVVPNCPRADRCCVNPDHQRTATRGQPQWRRWSPAR